MREKPPGRHWDRVLKSLADDLAAVLDVGARLVVLKKRRPFYPLDDHVSWCLLETAGGIARLKQAAETAAVDAGLGPGEVPFPEVES